MNDDDVYYIPLVYQYTRLGWSLITGHWLVGRDRDTIQSHYHTR